jgi:dolichol kinase
MVCDTMAEVGGALYGKQTIRVWGIGDVNRKSIGGTVTGFLACLLFCCAIVYTNSLPASFFGLAVLISFSNTVIELWSPRGTDDFFMATGNALICLGFGTWVLA